MSKQSTIWSQPLNRMLSMKRGVGRKMQKQAFSVTMRIEKAKHPNLNLMKPQLTGIKIYLAV